MKSIAGVLAVTLNLLILTLIWGFAYLHAYTDALSSTYWAEKYRYLPIPLIVVIIASMLIELGIIYQKELAAYFHWNTKETKGQRERMLTKETLEKTSDFQKNILRRGIIKAGLFLLGISLLAPDGILQMILFCASMICMFIQLFLDVFLRRKGIDIRVDANESWETYQRQLKNDSILCGISFVIFLAIELLFRFLTYSR